MFVLWTFQCPKQMKIDEIVWHEINFKLTELSKQKDLTLIKVFVGCMSA